MPQESTAGPDLEATARDLLSLLDTGRQTVPLSRTFGHFDLAMAYGLGEIITRLRRQRGETPVGRKIGFTNRLMWDAYGVRAPIWAPVYDTTTFSLAALKAPVSLLGIPEPKIEPEIVFALAHVPEPGMSETELLACVDWVALGVELVQSIFPGWSFAAADTVAGFGLHAGLYVGERKDPRGAPQRRQRELATFRVELGCNGSLVAHGEAGYVLGGPLTALRHLNDLVTTTQPLRAGEIITTGTLTLAAAVAPSEHWEAKADGISLAPVALSFASA